MNIRHYHPARCLTVVALLAAVGCTWVKPTPESETVRVLSPDAISTCKKLGTTSPSLVDKVAGISRSEKKVQKELETLASKSAATMGGDTIVPASAIADGQQTFTIYKCVGLPPRYQ